MDNHDDQTRMHPIIARGTAISRYRIIEKIGAGGMGEVYLADDAELKRKVALKFLSLEHALDPDFRTRFTYEAQAAAALSHPNIVTIYEVGEYAGRPFIAMEYIPGVSLGIWLRKPDITPERAVDIAMQICEGLYRAHQSGIVHRDIKPGNIRVMEDGRAKILDFGLAKLLGVSQLTKSGSTLGTMSYMSPEQVKGEGIDHRSDIFSLGVVLYEMITGDLPFRGEYEAAVLYALVYEAPTPATGCRSPIPAPLQRVINRALEKNPGNRYQSAHEMAADLKAIKEEMLTGQVSSDAVISGRLPSIAVLQFSDMSPDKDQEYFCDGMADEIINALTQIEGLRVAARTSTFQFKGQDTDIRRIGQLLNVDTVLEGSVRKMGNHLRITAQMVNVADGYYLWSEKYDRDMADLFAIQDEISGAIAEKLKVRFKKEEGKVLVKRYTANLEAYNLYLKGRYFWNRRYEGGLQKGIHYFQQAIDRDPLYALAYAGLADSFNIVAFYNYAPPHDACKKAKAAAAKALEIDNELAEAHIAMGWVKTFYDWDWIAAENEFKRGIELNPGYATGRHYYGLFLVAMGRFDESIAELKAALEFDPLSCIIGTSLGTAYYFARRHEEAIVQQLKTLDMDPNFAVAHAFLGGPLVCKARFPEAMEECRKAGALSGGSHYARAFLAYVHGAAGEKKEAAELLEQLHLLAGEGYVSSYHLALIYTGMGDADKALEYLEKAYDERDNWMVFLGIFPVFDALRPDPRFKKLLKNIGL